MAIVNASMKYIAKGTLEVTWANMLNGDTGSGLTAPTLPDKTMTVRGTFGAGGSVSLKGTDSGDAGAVSTWDVLNDSRGEGNALTFTARDTRIVLENPAQVAPHVTAGDGTTSLTVVLLAQSTLR